MESTRRGKSLDDGAIQTTSYMATCCCRSNKLPGTVEAEKEDSGKPGHFTQNPCRGMMSVMGILQQPANSPQPQLTFQSEKSLSALRVLCGVIYVHAYS